MCILRRVKFKGYYKKHIHPLNYSTNYEKLESYAENPFGIIGFGRDLTVVFFSDMTDRLDQAVANGAPFADLQMYFDTSIITAGVHPVPEEVKGA